LLWGEPGRGQEVFSRFGKAGYLEVCLNVISLAMGAEKAFATCYGVNLAGTKRFFPFWELRCEQNPRISRKVVGSEVVGST